MDAGKFYAPGHNYVAYRRMPPNSYRRPINSYNVPASLDLMRI